MKDGVVVGLRCLLFCRKLFKGKDCDRKSYKKPQYVLKKRISPIYI